MKYLRESIILRLLCVCITLSWSIPFNASADDNSFPGCLISNPCDCGCDRYSEPWPSTDKIYHGQMIPAQVPGGTGATAPNSGSTSCLCPPYNKDSGRVNCLLNPNGAGYPPLFDILFMSICAEESPNTTYFAPKIRYRSQTCNIACWTLSDDLNGDGDCDIIPSAFGIPTIRLCARMAVPSVPASGTPGDIDYVDAQPADPGYTPDLHLDFEGYMVDDNPLSNGGYDLNGNPISVANPNLQPPKICLYWDPDVYDTLIAYAFIGSIYPAIMAAIFVGLDAQIAASGDDGMSGSIGQALEDVLLPDLMDYNPVRQNTHKTTAVNPIFQLLINYAQSEADLESSVANLINSLPDYIKYSMFSLTSLQFILELGSWIIQNVGISVLKFIGSMNRIVLASLGCVQVPLGPFPPPYCQPLAQTMAVPVTYEICPTSVMNDGTVIVQKSTNTNPCASTRSLCNLQCWITCSASGTCDTAGCTPPTPYGLCVTPTSAANRNNIVHNSIRVGFTDYKPLCTATYEGVTDDGTCILINPSTATPSSLSASNGGLGALPLCTSTTPSLTTSPCIISSYLNARCAANPQHWYCNGNMRIAYSVSGGNFPTDYYDQLIPDCPLPAGQHGTCQTVWGIDLGSYADLTVKFPSREPSSDPIYDVLPNTTLNPTPTPPSYRVSDMVSLQDSAGNERQFQAIVTREVTQISQAGISPQEPSQICAYEVTSTGIVGSSNYVAIGCNGRATFPKPQVYECFDDICNSTYFNPAMVVELAVPVDSTKTDSTMGAVATSVPAGLSVGSGYLTTSINLAGSDYSAYATDSTFAKAPFSGTHVILNPQSIYGNYENGAAPYDSGWNLITTPKIPVYLNGIEYLNSAYLVGVENYCLTGYAMDDCFSGRTRQNCVLAELLNSNIIPCNTTFVGMTQANPGVSVCDPADTGTSCNYNNPSASYKGSDGITVDVIPCTTQVTVSGSANTVNSSCYTYYVTSSSVPGTKQYHNIPQCDLTSTDVSCDYTSPISVTYDNHNNITNVYTCQTLAAPVVQNICYLLNQPLCQVSNDGNGRVVPSTNTNQALHQGYIPNVDYYNYTPGITASNPQGTPQTIPNIAGSGTTYNSVISAAQAAFNAVLTTTYSATTCTSNKQLQETDPTIYANMMAACTTAQNASTQISAMCSAAQALITSNALTNACNTAQSSIQSILSDQFAASSITEMQTDATNAQNVVSTLMGAITAIGKINVTSAATSAMNAPITTLYTPSVCTSNVTPYDNMMQSCQTTRNISAKINNICNSGKKAITDTTSTLYQQLTSACNTAQSTMTSLLTDQFNTQTVIQMQADTSSAQNALSNLMSIINGFSSNPSLIQNIINTSSKIYGVVTSATAGAADQGTANAQAANKDAATAAQIAAAQIAVICAPTQSLIASPNVYPNTSTAFINACNAAQATGAVATKAIAALNTALSSATMAAAQISDICTQTNALITVPAANPALSSALSAACTTAQKASAVPTTALTALNTTISGFTQYNIANSSSTITTNSLVAGSSLALKANTGVQYTPPNFATMSVRNRTDVENGVCVSIPQPKCHATVAGNASWTSATVGTQSVGTCLPGYTPAKGDNLLAYCLLDRTIYTAPTVALDPRAINNACDPLPGISDIVLTQEGWPGNLPYTIDTTKSKILYNTNANDAGPPSVGCGGNSATSRLTFNVNEPDSVTFALTYLGVDDYATVEVNGILAYFVDGNGDTYYNISNGGVPSQVNTRFLRDVNVSGQFVAEYALTNAGRSSIASWGDTGSFATFHPNLDLAPYLVNGSNTVLTTWYCVGGGRIAYEYDYAANTSQNPTLSNISSVYKLDPNFGLQNGGIIVTPANGTTATSDQGFITVDGLVNNQWSVYCYSNPCQAVVTTSFDIGDIGNVEAFGLANYGVSDWGNVVVNGTLVYANSGYGSPNYVISPLYVYDSSWKDGIPPYPMWNTGNWGYESPNLNILPYLKNGRNTIVMTSYTYNNGGMFYQFGYKLVAP